MKMKFLAMGAALLLLWLPVQILAQNQAMEEESPSMEMLDFLGTFEDEDTGWVDPLEMAEMENGELENERTQGESHEQ